MPKVKTNNWRKFRLKYLNFIYTQKELLSLKDYCQEKLNTKASELYRFGTNPFMNSDSNDKSIDLTVPHKLIAEFKEIQRIQKKVKKIIAFNNTISGMNKVIFDLENAKKLLLTLSKFTVGRQKGNKKILFDQLAATTKSKDQKIEVIIDKLHVKLSTLRLKQERRNSRIFTFLLTKSFVLKDFNRNDKRRLLL